MQPALQITYRGLPKSSLVESMITTRASRLRRYCDSLSSCRVRVSASHKRHRRHGNQYSVQLEMKVPRKKIAITRVAPEHHSFTDIRVAIRHAFDAGRRALEDYVRRRRE